ncbi:hypothetical protein ScPMuIL_001661 [Solemya velum]
MRLGMCDDLNTTLPGMPLVQCDNADILTVNVFSDQENIDTIKSRIKSESLLINNQESEHNFRNSNGIGTSDTFCQLSAEADMPEAVRSKSVSCRPDGDKVSITPDCDLIRGDINRISVDKNAQTFTGNNEVEHHSVVEKPDLEICQTDAEGTQLTAPSHGLTQDVSVSVELENNRLSSVLENIGLPLLYIPTTKQLVAGKVPDINKAIDGDSPTSNNSSGISTEREGSDHLQSCESENTSLSENFTSGYRSNVVFDLDLDNDITVQNNSEISGLDETDLLMKVTDYDQLTCNSFEFDTGVPRTNTCDSLMRTFTDASSLSSISTGTDFSVSAISLGDDGAEGAGLCIDTGDVGFMEINLHSRNSFERTKNPSQDSGIEDRGIKAKRKGLTQFFSRNLFSRKSKEDDSALGWKLFGRIPPKLTPPNIPPRFLPKNRPMNLPSKDPEEAERHRLEYEAMVEMAKKKEQRELRQKKKQKQQQLRQEDLLVNASKIWTKDILPNWDMMYQSKKARDLWWAGIPPSVRGKVWKLAIGNELNITTELYEICVNRAQDRIKLIHESELQGISDTTSEPASSKESSVELIKLDVSRTFPQLCIFQMGGPYHDLLYNLLGAYACYRPDVGYVQGMSFIAAVLLLNMDVADAFICFSNLLNRPCQVAFFRLDKDLMKSYFDAYEEFFLENMPLLFSHFKKNNMTPDLYLIDWIFSLFSKSLPLDVACRVWDVFCRDSEEFLIRTSLAILKMYEEVLPNMDFIHLAQFLTKLPEDISADRLFRCIDLIRMTIDKKNFSQILANNKELNDTT